MYAEPLGYIRRSRETLLVRTSTVFVLIFLGSSGWDSRIDNTNLMSTPEYYEGLLALRSIDWLRGYILEGCISSAGVGSEKLIRSSRVALSIYIDTSSASELAKLYADLLTIMSRYVTDDRVIVPALAVLAFLLDCADFDGPFYNSLSYVNLKKFSMRYYLITAKKIGSWRSFFNLVKKCHYRSSNIPKLTLAVRIYSGLARHAEIDHEAMDKLCQMLLHPFPLVSDAFDISFVPRREI